MKLSINKIIIIVLSLLLLIIYGFITYFYIKKKTLEGYQNKKITISPINNKSNFSNLLNPELDFLKKFNEDINKKYKNTKETFYNIDDENLIKQSNEFKDNIIGNISAIKDKMNRQIKKDNDISKDINKYFI